MAYDLTPIEAQVASDLSIDQADAVAPVEAAAQYVEHDTGTQRDGVDPLIPWSATDELLTRGLVLLAERIFQDKSVPTGSINSFDDAAFGQSVIPRRLYSHLDEYTRHLAVQFGLA